MKKFMGRHLIIDAHGIDSKKLKDRKFLYQLLENLPEKLEMKIIRKPVVSKITSDDHSDFGYSGFVIILESHVSFHTWPEENYAAIDVFSCKDFNDKSATDFIKNFFRPKRLKVRSLIRG